MRPLTRAPSIVDNVYRGISCTLDCRFLLQVSELVWEPQLGRQLVAADRGHAGRLDRLQDPLRIDVPT
jgi:hypothetical protein